MTFRTNMDSDLDDVILNTDEFAETFTFYTGADDSGTDISVQFILDSEGPRYEERDNKIVSAGTLIASPTDITDPNADNWFEDSDDIPWKVLQVLSKWPQVKYRIGAYQIESHDPGNSRFESENA